MTTETEQLKSQSSTNDGIKNVGMGEIDQSYSLGAVYIHATQNDMSLDKRPKYKLIIVLLYLKLIYLKNFKTHL